jgi:hypothetical protein
MKIKKFDELNEMEIKYYDELSEFINNELIFKNGKVSLSLIDIMRLCESWSKEKKRLDQK